MTDDATNKAAIDAAVDTYTAQMVAEAVAAQQATDQIAIDNLQTTNASLQQQLTAAQAQIAALQAQITAAQPTTLFSAYAGPIVKDQYDPFPTMPNRVAAAYGVPVLPVDRVYSEGSYGLAARSLSPVVCASYKQVPGLAAGTASVISAVTAEIKALAAVPGKMFYVSCDHEVDNKIKNGTYTVTTYKAAATRFAQIVRSVAAPNIKIAVCYMGWTFTQPTTNIWHPANYFDPSTCDVIALDPYYTPGYSSASAAFDPCYTWAKAQGKPLHVWEVGFYTTGSQPQLTEAQVTQRTSDVIAYWKPKADVVLWFEANKSDGDNLLEGHPAALAAWAQAVQNS